MVHHPIKLHWADEMNSWHCRQPESGRWNNMYSLRYPVAWIRCSLCVQENRQHGIEKAPKKISLVQRTHFAPGKIPTLLKYFTVLMNRIAICTDLLLQKDLEDANRLEIAPRCVWWKSANIRHYKRPWCINLIMHAPMEWSLQWLCLSKVKCHIRFKRKKAILYWWLPPTYFLLHCRVAKNALMDVKEVDFGFRRWNSIAACNVDRRAHTADHPPEWNAKVCKTMPKTLPFWLVSDWHRFWILPEIERALNKMNYDYHSEYWVLLHGMV